MDKSDDFEIFCDSLGRAMNAIRECFYNEVDVTIVLSNDEGVQSFRSTIRNRPSETLKQFSDQLRDAGEVSLLEKQSDD